MSQETWMNNIGPGRQADFWYLDSNSTFSLHLELVQVLRLAAAWNGTCQF